ncbi:MAG: family 10 glycosylhydrolase [Armatimonadota bacterium]|nr:family 10 glycosylhydrolase [Armatimonadota bacterium]
MRFPIIWAVILAAILQVEVVALGSDAKNTAVEGRAIWVVRFDTTSPEKIRNAVSYAKKNNINVLIVQVRGRGDAFYKSRYEPRAEALEGQPEDFDPLQMYIEECRKAGIQVHAWLNTHYTWSSNVPPKSPDHIVNKHPEWLMRNAETKVTLGPVGQAEGAYTCPSNPEVKEHIRNCFLDVVENYDVDGINFDYVRYPSADYCYCDGCLSRFKEWMDKELSAEKIETLSSMKDRLAYVQAFPKKWDDFRRKQITDLVGQIYRRAHEIKPNIIVSADVFPDYEDAFNNRFQDWKLWMKLGIIDLLCPMNYTPNFDNWVKCAKDAVENANGRHVYLGIGAWQVDPEGSIQRILKARELGAQGVSFFAYSSVTKDGTDDEYLAKVKDAVYQEPAQVPVMEWLTQK